MRMMFNYLIDENLPSDLRFWNKENFTHLSEILNVKYDTDIWQYAIKNDLIIITKDTNFYYRSLASSVAPKVVWVKTGKMKKKRFNRFIKSSWRKVEKKLLATSFIKLQRKK
jgi:predicted nuclease of predicted toxin-antitoxin system